MTRSFVGLCLASLFFAISPQSNAQSFYVVTFSNQLVLIEPEDGCAETLIGIMDITPAGSFLNDICYHPNGSIYGISLMGLWSIDPATANATFLGSVGGANNCNALVAAADGTVYGTTFGGALYAIDVGSVSSTLLGIMPFASAGDLTFINGELYMASFSNQLILVDIDNPAASSVVMDFPSGTPMYGIVTFIVSCSEYATYSTSSSNPSGIYSFTTFGDVDFLCNSSYNITGAASDMEFLASECDLSLDLDENDDSGAPGIDFEAPIICAGTTSPIADLDVSIISSSPIDTIIVTLLAGFPDGPDEYLEVDPTPEITVEGNGTDRLLLINNGGADTLAFEAILRNTLYHNDAVSPTPGPRTVSVQAFSDGRESEIAYAFIELVVPPNPGVDTSIVLCEGSGPVDLFLLLGPDAESGGIWIPSPSDGSFYSPNVDPPGLYTYQLTEPPECPPEEASVFVSLQAPPDAGNDVFLTFCETDLPVHLLDYIDGQPDPNGYIEPPPASGTDLYDPILDGPGAYQYIIPPNDTCPGDMATITITIEIPNEAGADEEIQLCETQGIVDLFDHMPLADPGGSFIPELQSGSSLFDPAADPPGIYIYTFPDGDACPGDEAILEIDVEFPLPAGMSTSLTICSSDAPFQLPALIPDASFGGYFSPPLQSGGTLFNPLFDTLAGYWYIIPPTDHCPADSAFVEIDLISAPSAGSDADVQICEDSPPLDLTQYLTADILQGEWIPPLQGGDGIFDPVFDTAGTYTFVPVQNSDCDPDSAHITVTVFSSFYAGEDSEIQFCSSSAPVDLFPLIPGNPDEGGFVSPSLSSGSLVYQPGLDPPGDYYYILPENASCEGDSSLLAISVYMPGNAGRDSAFSLCPSSEELAIYSLLSSSADTIGEFFPAPPGGLFIPGDNDPGTYGFQYIVEPAGPCPPDTAQFQIILLPEPIPAMDRSFSLCPQGAPVDLSTYLSGQSGLMTEISPPLLSGGLIFDPSVDTGGTYRVIQTFDNGCREDTSEFTIFINPNITAGRDTSAIVCEDAASFMLSDYLSPNATANGLWLPATTEPGVFDPQLDTAGEYQYIAGDSLCGRDTAILSIEVDVIPVVGRDTLIQLCSQVTHNLSLYELGSIIDGLGGRWEPAPSGPGSTWISTVDSPGLYTFYPDRVNECTPAPIEVFIEQGPGLAAGRDTSVQLCRSQSPLPLQSLLSVGSDGGGSWIPQTTIPGIFDPGIDSGGTYRYILPPTEYCPGDTAYVSILLGDSPYAGLDSAVVFCSEDPSASLLDLLGGDPSGQGIWIPQTTTPGLFDPKTDLPGIYQYVVPGENGCLPDTASLDIAVEELLENGRDTSLAFCSDGQYQVDLQIAGAIDGRLEGTWEPGTAFIGVWLSGSDPPGIYTFTPSDEYRCLYSEISVQINLEEPPYAGMDTALVICPGTTPFSLTDALGPVDPDPGQWFPPLVSGNSLFDPALDNSDTYLYAVAGGNTCPPDTSVIRITRPENVGDLLGPDREICPGDTIVIEIPSLPGDQVIWDDGFTGTVRTITDEGIYSLSLIRLGCAFTDLVRVALREDCFTCPVYAPNAFSPNGDGVNDDYLPALGCEPVTYSLLIFNRWGDKVFESGRPDSGWDGTFQGQNAEPGVYAYLLRYSFVQIDGKKEVLKYGDITLIR